MEIEGPVHSRAFIVSTYRETVMPDSLDRIDSGIPPVFLGPKGDRPEVICDNRCVFLVDENNNFIGQGETAWGRGGPLARVQYAQRAGLRDL
jgi:hypothetical protein